MKSNFPKKYFSSVRTDKHVAPLSMYSLAIFNGLKFLTKIPAEGLAFLISEIIETFLLSIIVFLKL
jgi:hypothetical protein